MYGVSLQKNYRNKLYSRLRSSCPAHQKLPLKIGMNSSYFKLSIFKKAKIGCRNLENESLESIVLKFRTNSPVRHDSLTLRKSNCRRSVIVNIMTEN